MRVIVVGAGVIGLCCARALQRAGAEVTVLEQHRPGGAASAGNAGWVVPSLSGPVPAPGVTGQALRWLGRPSSPVYIRPRLDPAFLAWMLRFWRHSRPARFAAGLAATAELGRDAFAAYDRLRAAGLDVEEHRDGLLFAYLTERDLEHHLDELALIRPYGYQPQVLRGAALRAAEPALADAVAAGVLLEQERSVRPESLTQALADDLVRAGGQLRAGTAGTAVAVDRGVVQGVQTATGLVPADAVVVCTGAAAFRLLRPLGVRLPMQAGKGYSVDHSPPPVALRRPLYLHEARVALTPFDGMLRVAGTMELSGHDARVMPGRAESMLRAARDYLPALDSNAQPPPAAWAGLRPMTPDGLPVIGPVPGVRGAFVAGGHAMLGVTLGPVTGEHVADLVLTGRAAEVLRPFALTRRW